MFLMDDSLFKLFVDGKIRYQDMMEKAKDPAALQDKVKNYSAQKVK